MQKLKKAINEQTHAKKEQLKYIQSQINKIRNSVKDIQSQLASKWREWKEKHLECKTKSHHPRTENTGVERTFQ